MTKRNFKMTGFARFFLFLIIAAPLAYLGASYYNGEDGIENIKDMISGEQDEPAAPARSSTAPAGELEQALKKIDQLETENQKLRQELQDAELTIKNSDSNLL